MATFEQVRKFWEAKLNHEEGVCDICGGPCATDTAVCDKSACIAEGERRWIANGCYDGPTEGDPYFS